MNENTTQELRNLFGELFPTHNFRWRATSKGQIGFCPFHNDKNNASLSLYNGPNDTPRWKCFDEDIGGVSINAVMYAQECSKAESINWLHEHGYLAETENDRKLFERDGYFRKFLAYTNGLLCTSESAAGLRVYVLNRGVNPDQLPLAPIGYYPGYDETIAWLHANNVPEDYWDYFVLPSSRKNAYSPAGTLLFFYMIALDLYARIKFRNVLGETNPKDKRVNMPDPKGNKDKHLFFMPTLKPGDADSAILVEGECDALAIQSLCAKDDPEVIEPIYCFGGGSAVSNGVELVSNLGVSVIYAFIDNDQVGIDYIKNLAATHPHVFIIFPDDYKPGEDPADWCRNHLYSDLERTYQNPIPAFQWYGRVIAEKYKDATPEDLSLAKTEVIEYAKRLTPSSREEFVTMFANITGISPEALLEETITDDDCVYKFSYDSKNLGMFLQQQKGKLKVWSRISNFILEHQKDLIYDDGTLNIQENGNIVPSSLIRLFEFKIQTPHSALKFRITPEEKEEEGKFATAIARTAGSAARFMPNISRKYVMDAALSVASKPPREEMIYAHTGWAGEKFIMPNCYVDEKGWHGLEDSGIQVDIDSGSSERTALYGRYKFVDPGDEPLPKDLLNSLYDDVINFLPKDVTLPALAHVFLTPVISFLNEAPPYALWLKGTTGFGKTYFTALLQSFWGVANPKGFTKFSSTANAMERIGHPLKDVGYVIDDYKESLVPKWIVTQLIQNYGDSTGKSRMNKNLGIQKLWLIRGLLTITAEDYPPETEGSVTARTLVVNINEACDMERSVNAYRFADQGSFSMIMAKYIQWLCQQRIWEQGDILSRYVTNASLEYRNGLHNRIGTSLGLNKLGWKLFTDFLGWNELTPAYEEAIAKVATNMSHRDEMTSAASVFASCIKDMLMGQKYYLDGYKGALPTPHSDHATPIGFRDGKHIYILPGVIQAEFTQYVKRKYGTSLQFSFTTVQDQLITKKLMIPEPSGKGHLRKAVSGSAGMNCRYLKFVKELIEEPDEDINTEIESSDSQVFLPKEEAKAKGRKSVPKV